MQKHAKISVYNKSIKYTHTQTHTPFTHHLLHTLSHTCAPALTPTHIHTSLSRRGAVTPHREKKRRERECGFMPATESISRQESERRNVTKFTYYFTHLVKVLGVRYFKRNFLLSATRSIPEIQSATCRHPAARQDARSCLALLGVGSASWSLAPSIHPSWRQCVLLLSRNIIAELCANIYTLDLSSPGKAA